MALKNHIEKIIFAGALAGSAAFVGLELTQSEPDSFKQISKNQSDIQNALNAGKVTAKYPYSAEAANKVAGYKDVVTHNISRAADREATVIPSFAAYQRPAKPAVDPSTAPKDIDEQTVKEVAKIGNVEKVEA